MKYLLEKVTKAFAPTHNAFIQKVPPSECLACSKPISIDISYYGVEGVKSGSGFPTVFTFVGRVCSEECFNFYVLRMM